MKFECCSTRVYLDRDLNIVNNIPVCLDENSNIAVLGHYIGITSTLKYLNTFE